MKIKIKIQCGLYILVFFKILGSQEIYICKNSEPTSLIVISKNSNEVAKYASKELQYYIEKISDAKVPIEFVESIEDVKKIVKNRSCIFIGNGPWNKIFDIQTKNLKPDGFIIKTKQNCIFILGRDYEGEPINIQRRPYLAEIKGRRGELSVYGETGTLFGVYHLLETLGVRWYMPEELGEVIPHRETLIVKRLDIKKEPSFEYRYLHGSTFSSTRYYPEGCKWFKRAGFGSLFPVPINHSFFYLKKYKDKHPEIFALIDGKRDFDITCIGEGSLCLSEPMTLKLFVEEAKEFFDKYPKQYIFPIMPNDDYRRICECDKCKNKIDLSMGEEGKFSNYVWGFVNEVAKEIYKSHPDKFIGCCAYGHYSLPPKNVELSPNIVVMICKARSSYWNEKQKEKTHNLIKEWGRKVKNIYCWEYYNWYDARRTYHEFRVPVVFFETIKEDLKFMKNIGVKGEFIEVDGAYNISPGLLHLTLYITGKLLWNPDEDLGKLLDDYYEKFFGPAKEEMKKFYEKAEKVWMLPYKREEIYNKELVKELQRYIEKAAEKVSEDTIYSKRVKLIEEELSFLKQYLLIGEMSPIPIYKIKKVPNSPKIDGKLDEKLWEIGTKFDFKDQISGKEPYENTEGCIVYDGENLYLGFKCYLKKDIKQLKTDAIVRDDPRIWQDDCIEIFLDPSGSLGSYFHFIINAANIQSDAIYISNTGNPSVNINFVSCVYIGENFWSLEVSIPIEELKFKEWRRYIWRANFVRHHVIDEKKWIRSCWSPTLTSSSHNIARFGKLTFE